MEALYRTVYEATGGNQFVLSVVVGPAIAFAYFWLFNAPFMIVDLLQPKWAQPYKIQETKQVTWERYKEAMKRSGWNMSFYMCLASFLFSFLPGQYTSFGPSYSLSLPTWATFFTHLIFYMIAIEAAFYYGHRTFHIPYLYKKYHKIHHEWTAPISISSVYAHPIEHLFSNLLPIIIGPTLLGSHITSLWIWTCISITHTTWSHCGYHFPFQKPGEMHDYHHSAFNENFGLVGLFDRLHKTNRSYVATVHAQRNRFTASFVPIKEQYPDVRKTKKAK